MDVILPKQHPADNQTIEDKREGAPAARSHEASLQQFIFRTDRSAALLARSSKQERPVVDPVTLFNVAVRGHHR